MKLLQSCFRRLFAFLPLAICIAPVQSQSMETVIQLGHAAAVTAVAFSPDGKVAATGSKDKSIILWEASTGNQIRTFAGHDSEITDIRFTPDGKYLISGCWDHTVRIWDIMTGKMTRNFTLHHEMVRSVACDSAGTVFSAGTEGDGMAWASGSVELKYSFPVDPGQSGPSLDVSHDGKYLAIGNDNGRVLNLKAENGDTIYNVRELEFSFCGGCYTKAVFSPSGKYFLYAANRGPMILWSMTNGSKLKTFIEKQEEYASIRISPDEKYIASAGENTIQLWDLNSGEKIAAVSAGKPVNDIAFSPDDKFI